MQLSSKLLFNLPSANLNEIVNLFNFKLCNARENLAVYEPLTLVCDKSYIINKLVQSSIFNLFSSIC